MSATTLEVGLLPPTVALGRGLLPRAWDAGPLLIGLGDWGPVAARDLASLLGRRLGTTLGRRRVVVLLCRVGPAPVGCIFVPLAFELAATGSLVVARGPGRGPLVWLADGVLGLARVACTLLLPDPRCFWEPEETDTVNPDASAIEVAALVIGLPLF